MDTPIHPITIPVPAPRPRVLRSAAGWLLTLVALALAVVMFLPPLVGMQRYIITGGSMAPTYARGSIVFDRVVPTSRLRVGDVITYTPPPGAGASSRVTHRIHAIWRRDGQLNYRTKGDANATPDPWTFTLHGPTQARVAFVVPYAGLVPAALGDRRIRILVIGAPALLIALMTLGSLWSGAEPSQARRNTR